MSETTREKVRRIIFGTDTPAGKGFDIILIITIFTSVFAVMLASVAEIQEEWGLWLRGLEWFFTIVFTLEYGFRLWSAQSWSRYAKSFFGIVDFIAIVPTYLSLFIPGAEYLLVIRALRVLRLFRVLKLLQFVDGGNVLRRALWASRHKIIVFLFSVIVLVTIIGSIMYLIEGEEHGFVSIPAGVYWAIVTLTTVGYGDISPQTNIGQFLACIVMLMGYGIIAVPTGIVTAELTRGQSLSNPRVCSKCSAIGHADDAQYCRICSHPLS
jgi:voltage-gated potassium channel